MKITRLKVEITPCEYFSDSLVLEVRIDAIINDKREMFGMRETLDNDDLKSNFDRFFDSCKAKIKDAIEDKKHGHKPAIF